MSHKFAMLRKNIIRSRIQHVSLQADQCRSGSACITLKKKHLLTVAAEANSKFRIWLQRKKMSDLGGSGSATLILSEPRSPGTASWQSIIHLISLQHFTIIDTYALYISALLPGALWTVVVDWQALLAPLPCRTTDVTVQLTGVWRVGFYNTQK